MTRLRLRSDVRIALEYDDRTHFGSPLTERADRSVREIYAPLTEHAERHGFADFSASAPGLLAEIVRGEAFQRIATLDEPGAWRVRPEVLFPDPSSAPPRTIIFEREYTGGRLRANLPPSYWPRIHALIAALAVGGHDEGAPLIADLGAMLGAMREQGLVEDETGTEPDPALLQSDLTFVGHNTVVVRSRQARVIVDPFLFAGGEAYPAAYQPLQPRDVGPIDAILITHSHPDHFDPASLLQFPPQTRVIVPHVERETLLAVQMERRLRELGFERVVVLEWGQATLVGDIEVHALPFYGEQPTDGDVLHPVVRNTGNTYFVRTPSFSAVFLADSGRDGQGDVKEVATRGRGRLGRADIVFAGYRGWLTYPAQHLFSSVARFLPLVPPWLWGVRQRIMTDADDAVDVAERWEARYVAAYADGGAPWYWRIGLGPRLDEEVEERAGFDPLPERLVLAAQSRSIAPDGTALSSPVRPLLLRPGDSIRDVAARVTRVRTSGHAWPYADRLDPPGVSADRGI